MQRIRTPGVPLLRRAVVAVRRVVALGDLVVLHTRPRAVAKRMQSSLQHVPLCRVRRKRRAYVHVKARATTAKALCARQATDDSGTRRRDGAGTASAVGRMQADARCTCCIASRHVPKLSPDAPSRGALSASACNCGRPGISKTHCCLRTVLLGHCGHTLATYGVLGFVRATSPVAAGVATCKR